ncbi:MAG TPA: ATP-binding protein [Paracoccaceae bacterium]|nr:ATP-binding protein [Paracoccaceae bacterium]
MTGFARALPEVRDAEARGPDLIERLVAALERMSPPPLAPPDFAAEGAPDAYVWHASPDRLDPVSAVSRVDLSLLVGIDRSRDTLLENTRRFADGHAANNALLWGARGMGKSSLVKAAHAEVNKRRVRPLILVEIQREDIPSVGRLLSLLRAAPEHRFVLFCDDLSFDKDDSHYKSLKAVLDGGVEGRPPNVLFYATSNRRHLMPRDMIENERSSAINPSEATEEKVSLSDRFGLWLGFHPAGQDDFLAMIRGYCDAYGIAIDDETLRAEAIEWRQTRGSVSGRVAWQFVTDLAGRRGIRLA